MRVWFGDESQGLRRDREEFVLTIARPCSDLDAGKRFYCEGLDFAIVGVTSDMKERRVFLNHKKMPSVSLCLTVSESAVVVPDTGVSLDIGIWNEEEWDGYCAALAAQGAREGRKKLANPFQKFIEYIDPDGFIVRLTYTRPPVNTGKGLPD